MLFTKNRFKGGIHPKGHKEISRGADILIAAPGDALTLPMVQQLGAPSNPFVKKGDNVSAGDIIGTPSGFVSSLIHASISGTVTDIDFYPHPSGRRIMAVSIKPSENAEKNFAKTGKDVNSYSPKDIIDLVQKAGIVGMGGASFPTHVKLTPPKGKTIDTLIINAAECEPYLTADEALIRNNSEEIILGALLLQKAAGAKKVIFAMEDNKPEALEALEKSSLRDKGFELMVLPAQYPQGGEKQLIKAVLNREVPSGGLPMDVKALVQNVATAFAVYEAVYFEKPLIERIVSVTGYGLKTPGNYKVKLGTKLADILRQAGREEGKQSFVIMGGPMMGLPVLDMETPVIKSTSGILVIDDMVVKKEFPCIRCGRCIKHCPIGLSTTEIASAYNISAVERMKKLNALDCIECGCCAYMCPAGIPLVQYLKLSKAEIRKNERKTDKK